MATLGPTELKTNGQSIYKKIVTVKGNLHVDYFLDSKGLKDISRNK